MAQIMEFLLNLLLLRGKFLTTTAAETLHDAIKKCLQFKRKISMEYKQATQMIGPFDNMLEFINHNSSQYICEGENYIVTSDIRYQMYEHCNRTRDPEQRQYVYRSDMPTPTSKLFNPLEAAGRHFEDLSKNPSLSAIPEWLRREHHQIKNEKKIRNQDHIVDNLHAILKSQEFLFKNIIKLVNLLEKDDVLSVNSEKLERIKHKLVACTDILSNTNSHKFSNIINNIIEEEITRCRFRHGEGKTSAEINLKQPRPKGIEAALDTSDKNNNIRRIKKVNPTRRPPESNKIKLSDPNNEALRREVINTEVKSNSNNFLKRSNSEPTLSKKNNYETLSKHTKIDIENSKKLIQVNEEHFNKFEDTLWHTLTTMKFMSLKDDYLNTCKCAFYNKRQFIATESAIIQKIKHEMVAENLNTFMKTSDSMLQILEKKMYDEKQQELKKKAQELNATEMKKLEGISKTTPTKHSVKIKQEKSPPVEKPKLKIILKPIRVQKNQKKNLDEQGNNTVIDGNDLKKVIPKQSADASVAVVMQKDDNVVQSRQINKAPKDNKETNTIISSKHLSGNKDEKKKETDKKDEKAREKELLKKLHEISQEIDKVKPKPENNNVKNTSSATETKPDKKDASAKVKKIMSTPNFRRILTELPPDDGSLLLEETIKVKTSPKTEDTKPVPTKEFTSESSYLVPENYKYTKRETFEEEEICIHEQNPEVEKILNSSNFKRILTELPPDDGTSLLLEETSLKKPSNTPRGFLVSENLKYEKNEEENQKTVAPSTMAKQQPQTQVTQKSQENIAAATSTSAKPDDEKATEVLSKSKENIAPSPSTSAKPLEVPTKSKENVASTTPTNAKPEEKKQRLSTDQKTAEVLSKNVAPTPPTNAKPEEKKQRLPTDKKAAEVLSKNIAPTPPTNAKPLEVTTKSKENVARTPPTNIKPEEKKQPLPRDQKTAEVFSKNVAPTPPTNAKPLEVPTKSKENVARVPLTNAKPEEKRQPLPTDQKTAEVLSKNVVPTPPTPPSNAKPEEKKQHIPTDQKSADSLSNNVALTPPTAGKREDKKQLPTDQEEKDIPHKIREKVTPSPPTITKAVVEKKKVATKDKNKQEDLSLKAFKGIDGVKTPSAVSAKPKSNEITVKEGKKVVEPSTKIQTVADKEGKLSTSNPESASTAKDKTVSVQEVKSEADLLDVNKKAFEELEHTIKNVEIFVHKPSKPAVKSTTEKNKKRKIDEPIKKSMSTKNLIQHSKPPHKEIKREMKSNASRGGGDEKSSKHKRVLHTEIKKLPNEKCKTFLKNTSKSPLKKNLHSQKVESEKSSQVESVSEKMKPSLQMRRTTKNAMKRQQVLTIFPKITKESKDKKKPQIKLVETAEMKTVKTNQKERKGSVAGSDCMNETKNFLPKKIFHNSLANSLLKKAPCRKINCVSWEEEDDKVKIVSILDH